MTRRTTPRPARRRRHGSYNLCDFGPDVLGTSRYRLLVEVIGSLDTDTLAVQEIAADGPAEAGEILRRLATDTGMHCEAVPAGGTGGAAVPAVAAGVRGNGPNGLLTFHTGLLWSPRVRPVEAGLRAYHAQCWHGLVTVRFDVGPQPLLCGSWHGHPFCPDARLSEARRVAAAFAGRHGILGSDTNALSADRRPGTADFYDPRPDSYGDPDNPVLECQVEWRDDPSAPAEADRRATETLRRSGLCDTAVLADAPWKASCGHWPGDPWGPRRIDTLRATRSYAPSVHRHHTVRTDDTLAASDHLPVVAEAEDAAEG